RLSILSIERFQAKITTVNRAGELEFLHGSAGCKRAREHWPYRTECEVRLSPFGVTEIQFRPQLIQNRFFQSDNDRFFRAKQIENEDFIFTAFEPRTGQIHRLLRTNIPEPAQVVS